MRLSALLLLLVLPACFNPDDILPVHGSVVSLDPVAGQAVRLLRDPVALRTASCADAKPFKETSTDEAGNFSFDVFRAQATKLSGMGTFCFRVETDFASGGAAFSEILGLFGEVTLPPFPDWRAQPTRAEGALRFEPMAPLPETEETFDGPQLVHRAEWFTEDGGLAWVADDRVLAFDPLTNGVAPARQPMLMDDLALEDFAGSVTMSARLTNPGEQMGPFDSNSTSIEVRSGQRLQLSGGRRPISRGLGCPPYAAPCPLTDGDLSPVDAGVQLFRFTFQTPTRVSSVVVRGAETESLLMGVIFGELDGGLDAGPPRFVQHVMATSLWNANVPTFVVKMQPDGGVEFSPKSDPHFFTLTFDAGAPVSSLTVGFASGVDRIAEISLFE